MANHNRSRSPRPRAETTEMAIVYRQNEHKRQDERRASSLFLKREERSMQTNCNQFVMIWVIRTFCFQLQAVDTLDFFCGIGIKVPLIFEKEIVTLWFWSDLTINRPGFSMTFVAVEGRC